LDELKPAYATPVAASFNDHKIMYIKHTKTKALPWNNNQNGPKIPIPTKQQLYQKPKYNKNAEREENCFRSLLLWLESANGGATLGFTLLPASADRPNVQPNVNTQTGTQTQTQLTT